MNGQIPKLDPMAQVIEKAATVLHGPWTFVPEHYESVLFLTSSNARTIEDALNLARKLQHEREELFVIIKRLWGLRALGSKGLTELEHKLRELGLMS